jgi:hypothetical protein
MSGAHVSLQAALLAKPYALNTEHWTPPLNSLSLSRSLAFSLSRSLALSLSRSLSSALSRARARSLSLSLACLLARSLALSRARSLSGGGVRGGADGWSIYFYIVYIYIYNIEMYIRYRSLSLSTSWFFFSSLATTLGERIFSVGHHLHAHLHAPLTLHAPLIYHLHALSITSHHPEDLSCLFIYFPYFFNSFCSWPPLWGSQVWRSLGPWLHRIRSRPPPWLPPPKFTGINK